MQSQMDKLNKDTRGMTSQLEQEMNQMRSQLSSLTSQLKPFKDQDSDKSADKMDGSEDSEFEYESKKDR